jgi:hypothetical protein
MVECLRALWNSGNPIELQVSEIRELGWGIYGNHNKLRLEPWALVEVGETPKARRLTERGIQFMEGLIAVPRQIRLDDSGNWQPAAGTTEVKITNFPVQLQLGDFPE